MLYFIICNDHVFTTSAAGLMKVKSAIVVKLGGRPDPLFDATDESSGTDGVHSARSSTWSRVSRHTTNTSLPESLSTVRQAVLHEQETPLGFRFVFLGNLRRAIAQFDVLRGVFILFSIQYLGLMTFSGTREQECP